MDLPDTDLSNTSAWIASALSSFLRPKPLSPIQMISGLDTELPEPVFKTWVGFAFQVKLFDSWFARYQHFGKQMAHTQREGCLAPQQLSERLHVWEGRDGVEPDVIVRICHIGNLSDQIRDNVVTEDDDINY